MTLCAPTRRFYKINIGNQFTVSVLTSNANSPPQARKFSRFQPLEYTENNVFCTFRVVFSPNFRPPAGSGGTKNWDLANFLPFLGGCPRVIPPPLLQIGANKGGGITLEHPQKLSKNAPNPKIFACGGL